MGVGTPHRDGVDIRRAHHHAFDDRLTANRMSPAMSYQSTIFR
jgi:hypothetical protein